MKLIINESDLVNKSVLDFEQRTDSQLNRFLDTTPVFTVWYHINNPESMADVGWKDIEQLLGPNSPVRFNRISNVPIYQMDQVLTNLSQTEYGADIEYEGDGVLIPNTVIPDPNDFFMIQHLHSIYMFRIKEISYDTMRPNGYYKISFFLMYTDEDSLDYLRKQTIEGNICILENIGTERNSVVADIDYEHITKLEKMANEMIDMYMDLFYNTRHNCFLGNIDEYNRFYDQYMHTFIKDNSLVNIKNSVQTIYAAPKVYDKQSKTKYLQTVWYWIEHDHQLKYMNEFRFNVFKAANYKRSSFERYIEEDIAISDMYSTDTTIATVDFFSTEFVEDVKSGHLEEYNDYMKVIGRYIRNELYELNDIPFDLHESLYTLNDPKILYLYTPLILYIIKTQITKSIAIIKAI
jgi:hypothetical protein